MSTPHHVVVLGGGVIGVSVATHIQRKGVPATIVTDAHLGSGASGRSLSWLNSAAAHPRPYHVLRMAGIDRYRTLFAAAPDREWLRFDGGIHWAVADADQAEQERHLSQKRRGYDSRLLDRTEVAAQVAGIRSGAAPGAAICNPGEGWVSLPHLIDHLAAEFEQLGGRVITDAGVCQVWTDAGGARGVITAAGERIAGDAVVIACGAQTSQVVAELGGHVPDRSPWSMVVTTEPSGAELDAVINSPRVAMRPNPGATYCLDHDWYEDAIREVDGEPVIDEAIVDELVSAANDILVDGDLRPARWALGRKPVPGDGQPVFGELGSVPGAHVAFTHSGATLALIAGELVADEVVDGVVHPLLEAFRPGRFAADRTAG